MTGACGDGNDPPATATADVQLAEPADLVPDVGDLGYEAIPSSQGVIEGPGAKQYRADFQVPGEDSRKATFHIYTHEETAMAEETYERVRDGWLKPPPGSLGARDAENEPTEGPALGDERQSYQTTRTDTSGNRIWTDVYRFGTTVAVVQVLDKDSDDSQMPLRTDLASRVEQMAER